MTTRLRVDSARPYDVYIGHGVESELAALLPDDVERMAIIYAPTVADRVDRLIAQARHLQILTIEAPDAEQAKTPEFAAHCWSQLAQRGFTRSDLVIGVGGGATTDLAGFVAATWLRGVRMITMPTSVLGMVDAAVGGKTGINLREGKNLVGAFHEPIGVLCDLDALTKLPPAEIRSGLAEIVKCGFIIDTEVLDLIEQNPAAAVDPQSDLLADLIARGVDAKARTVAADLTESSPGGAIGREALNYGHTLGHAIERHENFGIRHGEAISIGMVFAAELAHRAGRIDSRLLARHRRVLDQVGLPTEYSGGDFESLLAGMRVDKKTRGSTLRFVVLDRLGLPVILSGPDESLLLASYQAISA